MPSLSTVVSSLVRDAAAGATAGERVAALDRSDLEDRLSDPPESFVEESEVDAFLRERFPPPEEPPIDHLAKALHPAVRDRDLESWQPGETAIRPYEVFLHPADVGEDGQRRFEGLERLPGLDPADLPLERRGDLPFLTPEAVGRIRDAAANAIGTRRRDAIRAVAESGIPEPVVEDVEMDVKLAIDEDLDARAIDARAATGVESQAVCSLSARMHFR